MNSVSILDTFDLSDKLSLCLIIVTFIDYCIFGNDKKKEKIESKTPEKDIELGTKFFYVSVGFFHL